MIAYRAMVDVPRELVGYVSRLLAAERRRLANQGGKIGGLVSAHRIGRVVGGGWARMPSRAASPGLPRRDQRARDAATAIYKRRPRTPRLLVSAAKS